MHARLSRPHQPLGELVTLFPPELDGAVIPGGCDSCNAEQRLVQVRPGIWSIGISHDDQCPTWECIQGRRGAVPDSSQP